MAEIIAEPLERLQAAIEQLEGWMRPHAYAAPETLGANVREAMAYWAAQHALLEEGKREFFRTSAQYPTDMFKRLLELADTIVGLKA